MNATDIIRRLHQHRMWANRRLVAAARSLTDEQLRQAFAIGQGSVWKSLCHMYGAEYVWLATLEGDENATVPGDAPDKLPGNQQGEGAIASLAELEERWQQVDAGWDVYLQKLSDADLETSVQRVSSSNRKRYSTRRSDVLLHVCTHAHYTTAQVMNMLRQLGVSPLPDPMLISLAREGA